MPRLTRLALIAGLIALTVPGAAAARTLIYSYDSTTPITRQMTENGLTFIFEKSIMNTRVLKIIETQDVGEAALKPASERELGGAVVALVGKSARSHDLYEITQKNDGIALVRALCPGAERGFLAIGPLKSGRDLTVYALGRDATGRAWLCQSLDYGFHGEWALPGADLPQPDRTDRFNDAPANHRF